MILFIDDQPSSIELYVKAAQAAGLTTLVLASVEEFNAFLKSPEHVPSCAVLDIMFPGDPTLPSSMTNEGLATGMPLFASLRSHFPNIPVVVLTNSPNEAVMHFFRGQSQCSLYYKTEIFPEELALVLLAITEDRAGQLEADLHACEKGKRGAGRFENLCVRALEYLFVPPLKRVLSQARRADGRAIRDAVLPNTATTYFWASIRSEFDSRHVVVEVKNYAKKVGKREVSQLREYLSRKTIGRFGLLLSRNPPSDAALVARHDAYAEHECLILFVADKELLEMIHMRKAGQDPAIKLQQMKEEFELTY